MDSATGNTPRKTTADAVERMMIGATKQNRCTRGHRRIAGRNPSAIKLQDTAALEFLSPVQVIRGNQGRLAGGARRLRRVTLRAVATSLGLAVEAGTVRTEGDLD
jgi:hypothetical protein